MCYCDFVDTFVAEVKKCGRLGISFECVDFKDPVPGGDAFVKTRECDRFKVEIPYSLSKITCNVVFHSEHPEFAPDLIITDSSFSIQMQELQSLCQWNPDDETSLLRVLNELFALYRTQQSRDLEGHSRLQFEYSSVTDMPEFSDEDVEVLMTDKNGEGPVHFLIRLPLDFANLPELITGNNPGADTALLSLTYQSAQGNRVMPHLYLSPRLESALGGSQALRIPNFPSEGCLVDYIPSVIRLLQSKIDTVTSSYKKREEYIAAFLSHFGTAVIEFDMYSYLHIAMLFEWREFFFILNIRLSQYFPEEQPLFIFQSVYHTISGKPFIQKMNTYPYSPRWSANEMATRFRTFIVQHIQSFQEASMEGRA